jgi:hypothetical protein
MRTTGLRDGPEPERPGQAGHDAASFADAGSSLLMVCLPNHGPDADRGPLQRQPYAGGDPRRDAGGARRPASSPAAQTGQAAGRHGLRSSSPPARAPGPQLHAADRSTGYREQRAPWPSQPDRRAFAMLRMRTRRPGSPASVASPSATRAPSTSISPSRPSAVPPSAGHSAIDFVAHSQSRHGAEPYLP